MVNIKNKKVLQQLEQYGDNLKQSRQVLHWAYFNNREDRCAFIREAEQLGYLLHAYFPYTRFAVEVRDDSR